MPVPPKPDTEVGRVTPDEPPPEKPFEVKLWWVALTAGVLWLSGVVSLLIYLFGNR